MRVLGVDPGTSVVGWGIVEGALPRARRVASGVIRLSSRASLPARLGRIHSAIAELLEEYRPEAVSLEKAFVSRNVQSAFRLGESRGMVLLAAETSGIAVFEYSPAEVKLSVAGYGRAEKTQIARGVALQLSIPPPPAADEADALAAALCHLRSAGWRKVMERMR